MDKLFDGSDAHLLNDESQLKSAAITDFVDLMIGALDAGFVDKNNPTLAEIHRVAENHIKDNFGIDIGSIVDRHGEDLALECGYVLKIPVRALKDDLESNNN